MRLLKISLHKAPSIFTKNETFCERKGHLNVFDTMRLNGDFHQKHNEIGDNGFRDLCGSLRVFFGAVNLIKI